VTAGGGSSLLMAQPGPPVSRAVRSSGFRRIPRPVRVILNDVDLGDPDVPAAGRRRWTPTGTVTGSARRSAPERVWPGGWNHLLLSRQVGQGQRALDAAAECVLGWGMHRGAGLGVHAQLPRAEAGSTVVVSIGVGRLRLLAPCRVIWTIDEPDRRGFGYAALPGHPEVGEEAFLVTRDAADAITCTIVAFSRPAHAIIRLISPIVVLVQHLTARRYARAVRRACASQ
jgi:uncharacterized protein (UPF0548 family)